MNRIKKTGLFLLIAMVYAAPLLADSTSANFQSLNSIVASPSNFLPSGANAYGKSLVPSDTTPTANVAGDALKNTCFNYTSSGLSPVDNVNTADSSSSGTQAAPWVMELNNSNTGYLPTTLPAAGTTVPYSGFYYLSLTMNLEQFQATTVYFWVDQWVNTGATSGNVRVMYSGDVPYTLNGALNSVFTVQLTGVTYLPAGSTIYAPRIWTLSSDPNTGTPTQFCVLNKNGSAYSTLYATLIKMP